MGTGSPKPPLARIHIPLAARANAAQIYRNLNDDVRPGHRLDAASCRRQLAEETSMKKHKLLIAVIIFGLACSGIVRAEDQPIEQQLVMQ